MRRWSSPPATSSFMAPRRGDFFAFDARTGQQLFKYPGRFGAPDAQRAGIAATPMTYRVDGKQYVSVVARTTVLTFGLP